MTLDANSTITLGRAWPVPMNGKVLLRDGSTFYLSDTDLGSGGGTSVIFLQRNWAVYDPATNLQFTGFTYLPHIFTDITAIGFYFNSFVNAGSNLSFSTTRVGADLAPVPEPSSGVLIAAGVLMAEIARRRRFARCES